MKKLVVLLVTVSLFFASPVLAFEVVTSAVTTPEATFTMAEPPDVPDVAGILPIGSIVNSTTVPSGTGSPANVDDGNKFLSQCNEAIKYLDDEKANIDRVGFASCVSYLEGFNHLSRQYQNYLVRQKCTPLYCLPKNGIVNAQSVRIIVKYLKDHPDKIHENKISLVTKAFMEAFPCP